MNITTETELGKAIIKAGLQHVLRNGVATVEFTKKDGSNRVMKCTLDAALLPELHAEEGAERAKKTENPNMVNVFDVEAQGWRSFSLDRLANVYE